MRFSNSLSTHKTNHVPAVCFILKLGDDGSFPAFAPCTKAVATAYQSLVSDIPGHECVCNGVCVFALLQMSLFIDG